MPRGVVGQDGSVALAGAAPLLDEVAAPVGEEGLVVGLLVVLGPEVMTQLVTEAVVAQCTGLKVDMDIYQISRVSMLIYFTFLVTEKVLPLLTVSPQACPQ